MAGTPQSIRDELLAYRSTDEIVTGALEEAAGAVSAFDAARSLDEVNLCLLNPAVASRELLASPYFTRGCQALLAERLIIVNEQFLLEIETAIRSFAQAETLLGAPFLRNDAQMFGLVRRIEADPARYLARLRRQGQRSTADADAERQLRQELAMVVLFFIGHELGHLLHGHPSGQFATFVDPGAPLERRVEDAVVKLCRHVDEFAPTQFGLPGFEQAADAGSDVRRAAGALRARDEKRYQLQEAFFANEAEADEWANQVVIAHLSALAKDDPAGSERALYLFACGVFVAALYTWYQDLDRFARKLGIEQIADTRELGFAMMEGRERYIHAASLFGERHRFTLLRAALALESILRARTPWFERAPGSRSIWCERPAAEAAAAEAAAAEPRSGFWLCESLQRYFLLCACMDTAVKLASVGCSTGWILEIDRKRRTPQLLVMQYMGIDDALDRVRQMR